METLVIKKVVYLLLKVNFNIDLITDDDLIQLVALPRIAKLRDANWIDENNKESIDAVVSKYGFMNTLKALLKLENKIENLEKEISLKKDRLDENPKWSHVITTKYAIKHFYEMDVLAKLVKWLFIVLTPKFNLEDFINDLDKPALKVDTILCLDAGEIPDYKQASLFDDSRVAVTSKSNFSIAISSKVNFKKKVVTLFLESMGEQEFYEKMRWLGIILDEYTDNLSVIIFLNSLSLIYNDFEYIAKKNADLKTLNLVGQMAII